MFKRVIKVEVFEEGSLILSVSDLRIDFHYISLFSDSLDKCRIEIYNLATDTIMSMAKNINSKLSIKMYAGYEDEGGLDNLVFHGRVTNMNDRVDMPNHITSLYCMPIAGEKLTKHKATSLPKVQSFEQALTELAGGIDLPLKFSSSVSSEIRDVEVPYRTVSGEVMDIIDGLCYEHGVIPSVDGDGILVIPENTEDISETIKDSDSRLVHKLEVTKTKGTPQVGLMSISFPYILDFTMRPSHIIDTSEYTTTGGVNGIANYQDTINLFYTQGYREFATKDRWMIFEVTHRGSNLEDVWQTDIKAKISNTSNTQGGGEE